MGHCNFQHVQNLGLHLAHIGCKETTLERAAL